MQDIKISKTKSTNTENDNLKLNNLESKYDLNF
jgi:hypothetical protein